jgi:hypothetical protein
MYLSKLCRLVIIFLSLSLSLSVCVCVYYLHAMRTIVL